MRFERLHTTGGKSAYAGIAFHRTRSEIKNPDGSIVFRAEDLEVPASWSQVAADILAKYDPETVAREVSFLYTKETRSSFEIEREVASTD